MHGLALQFSLTRVAFGHFYVEIQHEHSIHYFEVLCTVCLKVRKHIFTNDDDDDDDDDDCDHTYIHTIIQQQQQQQTNILPSNITQQN